jgi:hypothetical protein
VPQGGSRRRGKHERAGGAGSWEGICKRSRESKISSHVRLRGIPGVVLPSVQELLADMRAERALAKSLAHAHSIWDIVLHMAAWERVVRRRLAGEDATLSPEEDWPPVQETRERAWKTAVASLEQGHRRWAVAAVSRPSGHRAIKGFCCKNGW